MNKNRLGEEIKKMLILFIYFSIWFCALAFLSFSVERLQGFPYIHIGLALVKALLCAKFMLMGQMLYPIESKRDKPLIGQILSRSLVYLGVVILLSALESGMEGWVHHRGFISSLANFGNGDPIHILALSLIYWLIVLPYLTFMSLQSVIGSPEMKKIFWG
ncbi:hypothetical protein [Polynucleobacter acidiphobus]|uniref:hypothetical protein n=1 Tax=Polynucleobacter acidiphobus TaxID=556053 RepID=UPI00131EE6BB|nr:hypothetical protein [Polynucleobacter acidiphobus]